MSGTPDPRSDEAAQLRAAHELLDERAPPRVRSAVLRAASDGGTGSAFEVREAHRRAARRWFGWRPAAAATALLGVLAVGLALHLERETPPEVPFESRTPPGSAPMPASPAVSSPPGATVNRVAPASAATAGRFAPAPPPAADRAEPASNRPSGSTMAAPPSPTEQPPLRREARSISPAAAPPAQSEQKPAVPEAGPGTRQEADLQVAAPAAKAAPADRLQKSRAAGGATSRSPQEWLQRIVELRQAGRDSEADDELGRFRAAFPDAQVPADALRK